MFVRVQLPSFRYHVLMRRVQVRLTKAQLEALRHESGCTGRSVADLIREGVDRRLTERTAISRDERIRRALAGVGKFSSGQRDASAKHDKYLADAFMLN